MRIHKAILIIMVMLITVTAPVYAAAGEITVTVNGKKLTWDDIGARFSKGRVMVPVAKLGQALGAQTVWDAATQDAFIFLYDRYVWMQIANPNLYYGTYATDNAGTRVLTSVQALPVDPMPDVMFGRLTAPLGTLMEALDGQINWDGETLTADVTGPIPAPARQYAYASYDTASVLEETEAETAPGYFEIVTAETVLAKYEADEPMILVCSDMSQNTPLREVLRAAADLQMKVYGLDTSDPNNKNALPFMKKQSASKFPIIYFITGYERVTALASPDYPAITEAMNIYWRAD